MEFVDMLKEQSWLADRVKRCRDVSMKNPVVLELRCISCMYFRFGLESIAGMWHGSACYILARLNLPFRIGIVQLGIKPRGFIQMCPLTYGNPLVVFCYNSLQTVFPHPPISLSWVTLCRPLDGIEAWSYLALKNMGFYCLSIHGDYDSHAIDL